MDAIHSFCQLEFCLLVMSGSFAHDLDKRQPLLTISFDLPVERKNNVARSGQNEYFGHKGVVINLVAECDVGAVCDLERFYETEVREIQDLGAVERLLK